MRILFIATGALITLAVGAKVLVFESRPTYSLEPEVGRFQTALFGGVRRLHGLTYLMDSTTGRTWVISVEEEAKGWSEVTDEEGKGPEASSTIGRYRIETEYTGSPDGSERSVTVRLDTVTGRVWHIPYTSRALRWIQFPGATEAKR
jgi:hypothetical protein